MGQTDGRTDGVQHRGREGHVVHCVGRRPLTLTRHQQDTDSDVYNTVATWLEH